MGRRPLAVLEHWDECARCDRALVRQGVVVSDWPIGTKVIVLAGVPHREQQLAAGYIQLPSPSPQRLIERLVATLDLRPHEIAVDHLLGCGGGVVTADAIAACSERLDRLVDAHAPAAFVLAEPELLPLAEAAGVVKHGEFASVGGTRVPVVLGDGSMEDSIASILGRPTPSHPPPGTRVGRWDVEALRSILGRHAGVGQQRANGQWQRRIGEGVRHAYLSAHLRGGSVVAPLHPRGPWRYVVLDLDRHGALQEHFFVDTVAWVMEHFPQGIHVMSSESKGRHVYLPLPAGVPYSDAARWVRAYVALFQGSPQTLLLGAHRCAAEVIEVPLQPPRLPFGRGSFLIDSPNLSKAQAIRTFLEALERGSADFDRARKKVSERLGTKYELTKASRRRLDTKYLSSFFQASKPAKLAETDPWRQVSGMLPRHLRLLVESGIPAYGTRTTWTLRLVEHLTTIVNEERAERLMDHWLNTRVHHSADINQDFQRVVFETRRLVEQCYKVAGAVPIRCWHTLQRLVTQDHFHLIAGGGDFRDEVRTNPPKLEEALATAFFILRRYARSPHMTRPISSDEFGQFVGRNRAHVMQAFLEQSRTWLRFVAPAEPSVSSRAFAITLPGWPPLPDEPSLVVPPFELPRRRWIS